MAAHLEGLEEGGRLLLRHVEAVADHAGVHALSKVALGLLQQLADEDHRRRRPCPPSPTQSLRAARSPSPHPRHPGTVRGRGLLVDEGRGGFPSDTPASS